MPYMEWPFTFSERGDGENAAGRSDSFPVTCSRLMPVNIEHLGRVPYAGALRLQQKRVAARKAGGIPDTLLLLEHPHVYTLGRSARRENLLFTPAKLEEIGAEVYETDRGGDVTYHGPGQIVGYPIVDLRQHRRDVAWYMRSLEEVFIRAARDYRIVAERTPGSAGVFVGRDKLVAMGVHISRWVTSHGFAFNVNTDLRYFDWIVPCGLHDKGVTSLEKLLGHKVPMEEAAERVVEHFRDVFAFEIAQRQESEVKA
jgi:lipoyl(octanoyl) transferase